jgi:excinuclease ABC subunit A
MAFDEGTRFMVLAPVVRGRKGEYGKLLEELRAEGYTRVKVDGDLRMLEEEIVLDKKFKHDISVVVDRLVMRPEVRKRLADSVETAVGWRRDRRGRGLGGDTPEVKTFSERFACLSCGTSMPELEPRIFSFNSPHGACDRCTGLGSMMEIDPELVVPDGSLSIGEGALRPWATSTVGVLRAGHPGDRRALQGRPRDAVGRPVRRPSRAVPVRHQRRPHPGHVPQPVRPPRSYATQFEGIITNLERRYKETESELQREKIEEYMSMVPCPSCKGARLRPESRAVRVGGLGIHEFSALSVRKARTGSTRSSSPTSSGASPGSSCARSRSGLRFLHDVGIGYLSMDRAAATLSGGEAQRIRLATQIGSALVGVLYVLDEPSIGLHQRDNTKLIGTLERLRDLGNTVLVVEHDEQTMLRPTTSSTSARAPASTAATSSPRARPAGHGQPEVADRAVPQRQALDRGARPAAHADRPRRDPRRQAAQPQERRRADPAGDADVRHRRVGLGQVDAGQRGALQVAGQPPAPRAAAAGQPQGRQGPRPARQDHPGRPVADRPHAALEPGDVHRPVRRHPRPVRQDAGGAGARLQAGRFSFNVKGGRCEICRGDGQIKIEMHFLPDIYVPCEQCHGKRYNRETLQVRFKGKTIADVLEMPVEEALEFFQHIPKIRRRLETLNDVGLGYIRLGQPATTLSGGEAQRVKLATELSKIATGRTMYILDEPTTGLHFADVERLLEVLHRLVDAGNSVVVIEHNLDVIKTSDRLIDMGPEGGDEGGMVVATGTPEEVAAVPTSYTGQFLADLVTPAEPKVSRGKGKAKAGTNGNGNGNGAGPRPRGRAPRRPRRPEPCAAPRRAARPRRRRARSAWTSSTAWRSRSRRPGGDGRRHRRSRARRRGRARRRARDGRHLPAGAFAAELRRARELPAAARSARTSCCPTRAARTSARASTPGSGRCRSSSASTPAIVAELRAAGIAVLHQVGTVAEAGGRSPTGPTPDRPGHPRGAGTCWRPSRWRTSCRGSSPWRRAARSSPRAASTTARPPGPALDAGAAAVWCGSRFLLTEESRAHPAYKARALGAPRPWRPGSFGLSWPERHRVLPNAATEPLGRRRRRARAAALATAATAPLATGAAARAAGPMASLQRVGVPLYGPAPPLAASPSACST